MQASPWLLLVLSLPTSSGTARMRIWRALKSLGCVALRDGAYLLPLGPGRADALRELGDECVREGGSAWVMSVEPGPDDALAYRQLFDRSEQYAEQRAAWKAANRTLTKLPAPELARLRKRLQRDLEAIRAIDFFPSEASVEAEAAWLELAKRIDSLLAPDEPHQVRGGAIPRLDPAAYRGRTWATRRRLWVDRVASAWLIRRFIDPDASFRWLAKPSDCPKSALGFDFDGAAFTHVDDRVTFETLMASFGLEDDLALARLATIVHALDVGGEPVAEAVGFEAVMAGARERISDDDALLAEMSNVLDSLYAHFERQAQRAAGPGAAR